MTSQVFAALRFSTVDFSTMRRMLRVVTSTLLFSFVFSESYSSTQWTASDERSAYSLFEPVVYGGDSYRVTPYQHKKTHHSKSRKTKSSKGKGGGSSKGSSKKSLKSENSRSTKGKGYDRRSDSRDHSRHDPSRPGRPPQLPPSSPPGLPTPPSPSSPDAPSPTLPFPLQTPQPTLPPVTTTTAQPVQTRESVSLEPFTLTYIFSQQDREPFDTEVTAAVSITRTYLNGFFKQRIADLDELETTLASIHIDQNQPFQMNLTSVATFAEGANSTSTEEELNLLRVLSFSGEHILIYVGLLQSLPQDNIFSGTIDVSDSPFTGGVSDSDTENRETETSRNASSTNVAVVASVGAGSFLVLLIGLAVHRHIRRDEEFQEAPKSAGIVTVAGETYTGQSTMYSSSSPRSRSIDDNQSEWGISTHAHTEDNGSISGEESMGKTSPNLQRNLLGSFDDYGPCDPLQNDTAGHPLVPNDGLQPPSRFVPLQCNRVRTIPPAGSESEDDDVPLRVVDLIKKFSPL